MLVIVTRDTQSDGEPIPASPEPQDLPEMVARALLNCNKAKLPPEPEPEPEPEPVTPAKKKPGGKKSAPAKKP